MGYGALKAADEMIKSGQIAPMLIVLPQGDQAYWLDLANGSRWGEYMAHDVVTEIDMRWRTIRSREARALGGLSMGAQGALQLGLRNPDTFGIIGAHSPTLRNWGETVAFFPPDFYGDEAYFNEHEPFGLATANPDAARRLKIWLDVGADDAFWTAPTTAYSELLTSLGVPHELHYLPGNHNGDEYWRLHTKTYLRFYARAFLNTPAA
jgi:enterochelin esterase-like enzyme